MHRLHRLLLRRGGRPSFYCLIHFYKRCQIRFSLRRRVTTNYLPCIDSTASFFDMDGSLSLTDNLSEEAWHKMSKMGFPKRQRLLWLVVARLVPPLLTTWPR